jgi:hypothetical protein
MKKLCLLLASALLLCASPVAATPVKGTVNLHLTHLFGMTRTGQPDPGADRACRARFGNLVGWARTTYSIDPQTLYETAQTTFHGATYTLNPLGIAGMYALAYFQNPFGANPPIYSVRFVISLQFTNPRSAVLLMLNDSTMCLLTNAGSVGRLPPMM